MKLKLAKYFAVEGMVNMSADRPRFHDRKKCLMAARLQGLTLVSFAETTVENVGDTRYDARFQCAACRKQILAIKPEGVTK